MKYFLLLIFTLPALMYGAVLNYAIDNAYFQSNFEANRFDFEPGSQWVYTTAPGSYRLPVRMVNIILPNGAENISSSFSVSSRKVISGQPPQLNTAYSDGERILTSQPALQPAQHVIYQGQGKWGDVQYARFAILPALYDAQSGNYELDEQINLSVSYTLPSDKSAQTANIPAMLIQDPSFINKDMIPSWYRPNRNRNYDYLIVSTPELYAAAQPLTALRQSQGLITAFADINQIMLTSSGANPVEKLRNHLILEYVTSPFTYLLLIGDTDLIPIAYLTPEPNGNETVPSDFYYSDLSSPFDSDNDGRLGEYDTGMDYTPELFVGRIPWNDAASVAQISTRIAAFEADDFAWKQKALLPAAMLNYANEEPGFEHTDGATFMEYCKSNILRNYQNTTLYEQAGILPSYPSDHTLQSDTLRTLINTQSWGIVNWSAHGSPTSSARKVWMNDWDNDNIPDPQEMMWYGLVNLNTFNNLANQDGSVYFCASCNNGMLDYTETSLGEWLILKKAVADIAATRTGWYKIGWENPGWGGLSSYNYHFLENYAQHGMTVGQAHSYANWLHTQYCLFGDPIDSNGIIWPELQNIYTYLLFGDPAIGYPSETAAPEGKILVWEPIGNTGNTVVNGLLDLAPYNVVYARYLIDSYNYLNQFDAVFCLFGFGADSYSLTPDSTSYAYLL
ncbi:MAG: C25 family cysteine peptidase, partial [Candidatus Cloacimonadaceae bacterium]